MSDSQGLRSIPSAWSVKETADRLDALATSKGLTLFARIDHAANAKQVGMALAPMELLIFGNPKVGTLLMQEQPTLGIDLPVKALVWQDGNGLVQVTYNDTAWLAQRHHMGATNAAVIHAIDEGLRVIVTAATVREGPPKTGL